MFEVMLHASRPVTGSLFSKGWMLGQSCINFHKDMLILLWDGRFWRDESTNVSLLYFIIYYLDLGKVEGIYVFSWVNKKFRNIM